MPLNRSHIEEGVRREVAQTQMLKGRDLNSDEKHKIRKQHEQHVANVEARLRKCGKW